MSTRTYRTEWSHIGWVVRSMVHNSLEDPKDQNEP